MFRKVWADLQARGIGLSEHRVRGEMERLYDVAAEQVQAESAAG